MPTNQTKHTTSKNADAMAELSVDKFHATLRAQATQTIRGLLESVMREELTALLGAEPGEQDNPGRTGWRNGSYQRDLVTSAGTIDGIRVPRDRDGQYQTQVFERYARYQPEVTAAMTQMDVNGVSQGNVAEVTAPLLGVKPSASAVSRLTADLATQDETWRMRPLKDQYRVIYLDGIWYPIVHTDHADQTPILVALGVDLAGEKEILTMIAGGEERKEAWLTLLADLTTRGVQGVDLFITDGGEGLLAALVACFPRSGRQRCITHKMRNVLAHIPKRMKAEVGGALSGIFAQPTRTEAESHLAAFKARYGKAYAEAIRVLEDDLEACLTYYAFPEAMHKLIRTTNALEGGVFSKFRLRTNNITVFQHEQRCLMVLGALLQTMKLQKIPVSSPYTILDNLSKTMVRP